MGSSPYSSAQFVAFDQRTRNVFGGDMIGFSFQRLLNLIHVINAKLLDGRDGTIDLPGLRRQGERVCSG
jgi:hypothetical protein